MEYIGPFTFQCIRCSLAVLFLIPLSFLLDLRNYSLKDSVKKWFDLRLWKAGALCGAALFVAASLQQIGLVSADAGKAGFITAMYIVLVPILGIFIGQRPSALAIFSVALAVIGLYFLSCMGSTGIQPADFCLIGCAFAFAVQIRFVDRFSDEIDGIRLNCVQSLFVAVISIPFALLRETIVLQQIGACWTSLLFAGVLSMGVAYSLQIIGQKHIAPTPAALIMSLESVFAALGGRLILNETMTVWEFSGCALVFLAVVLSQIPIKHNSAK